MTLEEARASGLPISTGAAAGASDVSERPEKLTDVTTPTMVDSPPTPAVDPVQQHAAEKAAAEPSAPPPAPPPPVEVPMEDRIKAARALLEDCGCTVLDHEPDPVPVVAPGPPAPEQVLASALPPAPRPTLGWHIGQTFSLSGTATAGWYRAAVDVIRGVRTFLFFGVTGVIALADATGTVDVSPLFDKFLPESVTGLTTSELTVMLSIAGLWLRMVTKTAAFHRWRSAAGRASDVDSPEEEHH